MTSVTLFLSLVLVITNLKLSLLILFFLSPTIFYLTMVRCRELFALDHTQGRTTVGRTPLDE